MASSPMMWSAVSGGDSGPPEYALTHMGDLTRIRAQELDIPLGGDINR